jgi:hypothetical protein
MMSGMARRRIHIRMPGVKPGQKIGPLGPFRGRLGVHWVIASVVVGALILAAGVYYVVVFLN